MTSSLDMNGFPAALCDLLERYGFDAELFQQLRARCRLGQSAEKQNRLSTPMHVPLARDFAVLPPLGTRERAVLTDAGRAIIARGELAVVILAGGMATRFGGLVKACVEVVQGSSFLDLKLRDIAAMAESCNATIPVYLMSSFASDPVLGRAAAAATSARVPVATFAQSVSLRLTRDGELFLDASGGPSPYAPGHGDLVPALQRAGLVDQLAQRGVKYLFMTNIDNLAATLEPALLQLHSACATPLSFEVVKRHAADQGGTPARVQGALQVIEALREPAGFDRATIPWFSTNCLYLTVGALQREFPLDWFMVEKRVDGRPAIQYERFVNQLTAFLPSRALQVERAGPDARFYPIKEPADLVEGRAQLAQLLDGRLAALR